jgi:GAF domain-containing protein
MKALHELELMLDENGYSMDIIGKMATTATVLHIHFPHWIFAGFYRHTNNGTLEIGPYQGPVIACTSIKFGKGVCGTAAQNRETVNVPDISKYPNYITCDEVTKSEIVIPIIKNDDLIGVLDIDSPNINDFDHIDEKFLADITEIL